MKTSSGQCPVLVYKYLTTTIIYDHLSRSSSPPENPLYAGDSHPVHDVSGQSEGDSLWGGEDLPLFEGHSCKRPTRTG